MHLYISQKPLTMLRASAIKPASNGWNNGWAPSSGQVYANKFLANWSKEKLDSLHFTTLSFNHIRSNAGFVSSSQNFLLIIWASSVADITFSRHQVEPDHCPQFCTMNADNGTHRQTQRIHGWRVGGLKVIPVLEKSSNLSWRCMVEWWYRSSRPQH
jgi:hypothetical protein